MRRMLTGEDSVREITESREYKVASMAIERTEALVDFSRFSRELESTTTAKLCCRERPRERGLSRAPSHVLRPRRQRIINPLQRLLQLALIRRPVFPFYPTTF
jgi:hypothetical protein